MFNWNLIWMRMRQIYCERFGHDIRNSQYDKLACIRCGETLQTIRSTDIRQYDVVGPIDVEHYVLCSGSHSYDHATVLSVDPFILVSEEGDMRWDRQRPEDFITIRRATHAEVGNAIRRKTR